MYLAYKYRLKPNKDQLEQLQQVAGSTRWLWNYLLGKQVEKYEYTKQFAFYHEMAISLPKLKQEHEFLKQVPSQSLQQAAKRLDKALKAIWQQGNGFPKFKSKKHESDSFLIPQTNNHIEQNKQEIKIPKLGWVSWNRHRPITGIIKNLIIKQEQDKWYAVLVCDVGDVQPITEVTQDNSVGLDLGLIDLAVLSDGSKVETKKFFRRSLDRLKSRQRKLSHKRNKEGSKSKRYSRLRKQVARLHRKIKNQRMDFLHKETTAITKQYCFIGIEDLNIKGMIKNRSLARSIQDQGWGILLRLLAYKAELRGGQLIKIDRWAPSTKECSCCHHVQNITLDERTYKCACCGNIMSRDLNAAINILRMSLEKLDRCGTHRIHAQGDTNTGHMSFDVCRQVSLNCEKRLGSAEEATKSLASW
jgi:putative transposase